MPAKPLTTEQKDDANRLKAIFQSWQSRMAASGKSYSQDEAAETLLGIGQSGLSQYLNGKIPLNITAAVALASGLGVKVAEFSPALAREIRSAYLVAGDPDGGSGETSCGDMVPSPAKPATFAQYREAVRFLLVNDVGTPELVADALLEADENFLRGAFEERRGLTLLDVVDELRVRPSAACSWVQLEKGQVIVDPTADDHVILRFSSKLGALLDSVVQTGLYGETKEAVVDGLVRRGIEAVLPMVTALATPARR
jgi:transcriptional regulator with XRE-family HTH domain